ncbi:hypothetical protein GBAR_LOCUS19151 [Geodia barretti]|uniref:Uncharacterized protein n=1 Tax=Geodia barretti TaxID=519541 RepID=A0AA35SRK9_GEOBA|nr:hypothetical protein GBAR_LOCUS19151 [Geodia barretti]
MMWLLLARVLAAMSRRFAQRSLV